MNEQTRKEELKQKLKNNGIIFVEENTIKKLPDGFIELYMTTGKMIVSYSKEVLKNFIDKNFFKYEAIRLIKQLEEA